MAAEAGNAPNMEAKAWKWGLELEDKFTDRYAKIEQSVMKQAGNITKAIEGNGAAVTKMENAVEQCSRLWLNDLFQWWLQRQDANVHAAIDQGSDLTDDERLRQGRKQRDHVEHPLWSKCGVHSCAVRKKGMRWCAICSAGSPMIVPAMSGKTRRPVSGGHGAHHAPEPFIARVSTSRRVRRAGI